MPAIIMARRKLTNAIFSNQLSLSTVILFVVTFSNIDQTSERGRGEDVNIVNRHVTMQRENCPSSDVVITNNNPHPPLGHVCVSE